MKAEILSTRRLKWLVAFVMILSLGLFCGSFEWQHRGKIVMIQSGLRLVIANEYTNPLGMWLAGVQTPEGYTQQARNFIKKGLESTPGEVDFSIDAHGSNQITVSWPGQDGTLNLALVREGLARCVVGTTWYRHFCSPVEEAAKAAGRGLWARLLGGVVTGTAGGILNIKMDDGRVAALAYVYGDHFKGCEDKRVTLTGWQETASDKFYFPYVGDRPIGEVQFTEPCEGGNTPPTYVAPMTIGKQGA